MSNVASQAFKYALLPGFVPRVRDLLCGGFGFIPYSMACVFQNARLIPDHHPYTNPANIGKFGVRQVLAQAAANLKFTRQNTDQIILFGLMVLGIVLFLTQLFLLGMAVFMQSAHAGGVPLSFSMYFESPNPTDDISYIILDRIFGIPDLFNSCVAQNLPCIPIDNPNPISGGVFPQPYHLALQSMLGFYSIGLLCVGTVILCYYVVTILAEMSETGTAFGKRFNRAWAPMRIIIALGLLVPMAHNYNAAQYITLYVAKWGSAFGTNSWNLFIATMALNDTNTLVGDRNTLIAKPQNPSVEEIIQFLSTAWTCKVAYERMYNRTIDAYAVRTTTHDPSYMNLYELFEADGWYNVQEWYEFGDVVIAFGEHDEAKHAAYKGNVRPYCGEMVLPTLRISNPDTPPFTDGADAVSASFLYSLVLFPWENGTIGATASLQEIAEIVAGRTLPIYKDLSQPLPSIEDRREILDAYNEEIATIVDQGTVRMQDEADWEHDSLQYGWAGAGIWYNKIAQANGDFTDAVFNLPTVTKYPEIMEWVKEEKGKNNASIPPKSLFEPTLVDGQDAVKGLNDRDRAILTALNQTHSLWSDFYEDVKPKETGNVILDGINSLFKKTGLWTVRDNEAVHPLASMASLGKALLSNSITAFGGGAVTGLTGVAGIAGNAGVLKTISANLSSFLVTIGYVGLMVGITLYYVVPLMPFIYFFFAVFGWAKTIFEAMIGIPLWALAHLRIEGDGFPTRQSMYGYYLLIDIFLRPTLIVFGLMASMSIFYAMARTLNNVFETVISNLSGFDGSGASSPTPPKAGEAGSLQYFRGPIDQLFFTILYTMIVYMIGMSCFKLIDLFPNTILRWMGSSARGLGSLTQEDSGMALAAKVKGGAQQFGDEAADLTGTTLNRIAGSGGREIVSGSD